MHLSLLPITQQTKQMRNSRHQQKQNTQKNLQQTIMHLLLKHATNMFQIIHKQKPKQAVGLIFMIFTLSYIIRIQDATQVTNGFLMTNQVFIFSQENFTMRQQIVYGAVNHKHHLTLHKNSKHQTYHLTIWFSNPTETCVGVKFHTTQQICKRLSQTNYASTVFLKILRSIVSHKMKNITAKNFCL